MESKRKRHNPEENVDHTAISLWLSHIKHQTDMQRYEAFAKIIREVSPAYVNELLRHLSPIELMNLISIKNFTIVKTLTEFIACNTNDLESSSHKLLFLSKKILMDHELFDDKTLEGYWEWVSPATKPSILQALDITVFATLFVRASEALTNDLLQCLPNYHWLALLAHNDFLFCRKLVSAKNIKLSITKLDLILKQRFREQQQALALTCLKTAILENSYDFFFSFANLYSNLLEILLSLNTYDLLITACNCANPAFLNLLIPHIVGNLKKRTLILVATWLTIELNAQELEHDQLRCSLIADINSMLVEDELLQKYQHITDEEKLNSAKIAILEIISGELSGNKKTLLLTALVLQVKLKTNLTSLLQYLVERSNLQKHLCIDQREFMVTQILNTYLGYNKSEFPISQASQHEKYHQFKSTTISRLSLLGSKSLRQEIENRLNELRSYRAVDLSLVRRMIMPRATLDEQKKEVEENIYIKIDQLSAAISAVWLDSLDISEIPGSKVHFDLAATLLYRNPSPFAKNPMLVASIGFFVQLERNMKQILRIPIRMQDQSIVKISADVPFLTNDTGALICEHPLKSLIYYLLYDAVITKILRKAVQEGDPIVKLVHAITLDCHTNVMPCKSCLQFAADAQKTQTILDKIITVMKSRNIPFHPGNLTFLIRISLQSITKVKQPQILEAKPESLFTTPSSQFTPFSQQSNSPSQTDHSRFLLKDVINPVLVLNIADENCPPPKHFEPRYYLKPSVMPNMKWLSNNSIVIAQQPIAEDNIERPPEVEKYTALIGSCNP